MSATSNHNDLAAMLKRLFAKIFSSGKAPESDNPFNSGRADKSEEGVSTVDKENILKTEVEKAGEKAIKLAELIEIERDKTLESGNFVKAYALEHQRLVAHSIGIELTTNTMGKTPEQIAERAKANIEGAILNLQDSETVKKEFQDYHNHDSKKLATAVKEANDFVASATKDAELIGYGNNLNSTLKEASLMAVDYMKKSPDSPAQKAGLEPVISVEDSGPRYIAINEHDHAAEDDGPQMAPGA